MKLASRLLQALTALALITVPLASVAPAAAQSSAPAEDWDAIRDALGDGDVQAASATYQDRFQGAPGEASQAEAAVEDALQQARQAQTETPTYAWASQVIKKGILAISYEAIHAAADEGDAEQAAAYFDVLAAKFNGDDQLPQAKQAFDDLDAEGLDSAVATLEDEHATLITAKVYAETEETPELLDAGEPSIAAKEAGEALGYGLGLQSHLDDEAAATLHEELEELGEYALAEDAQAASAEADEILDTLAAESLAWAPTEKVDARGAFLDALSQDLDQAKTVYEENFAEHATSYAPEAHDRVQDAFANVAQAEGADLAVQEQILAKALLDIAWNVGFTEMAENELHEGTAYLLILVEKFDDPADPGELGLNLGHVAASQNTDNQHLDAFRETATAILLDKVYEEIDEVFINWDDQATAREKAIEGVVYYQPIYDEVSATLSDEDADHLDDELRGLYDATTAGDRDEAEHEAEEAREILQAFENAGGDVSELDQAITEIERTLNIITMEIEEYVEYKEEGNEAKAQEEIDESKAFIGKALSVFEEHRDAFDEADEQAAADLEADMDTIQQRLEAEEQIESIPDLVTQAVERLDAFETIDPDRPAVDLAFGQPQATDDGYTVPIQLVDPPTSGYSLQATITYDADELTVEGIDIPAEVGAQTTSPGEVRFNAASTQAEDPAIVANLHVQADEQAQPELSIDVETLTDEQGEPLRLGNVSGERLELASAAAGDAGSQPTPSLGLPALLLGLLATSLIAHRRS